MKIRATLELVWFPLLSALFVGAVSLWPHRVVLAVLVVIISAAIIAVAVFGRDIARAVRERLRS